MEYYTKGDAMMVERMTDRSELASVNGLCERLARIRSAACKSKRGFEKVNGGLMS